MRGRKAIKTTVCIAAAALFMSIPATFAHGQKTSATEQGVAGFAEILDKITAEEMQNAYKASIKPISNETETEVETEAGTNTESEAEADTNTEVEAESISPYANLGVSIAENYVNIRKEPSTESEVVGKLYRGCAADILEYLDGGWVKIVSGEVEGYIASMYLAIGEEAETMVDKYADKYATVNTETLRVRAEQSTESTIQALIPRGETYPVLNEYEEWVEILLGNDDENGSEYTGYVHKDYVDITVEFDYAISIEEELRQKKAQEEAERAEAERKRKLAQEEAERAEAARKAAEAEAKKAEEARKAAEAKKAEEASQTAESTKENNSGSSSQEEESTYVPSTSSSSLSELRNEVVNYALKFVGNRYVWGGESLTKGADCSGFVQAIYADFGYRIPRVSRDQAASAGKKVSESDMQPGDLIFYASSSGRVNHVAMYIGNGMIVHAANSRQGIIKSKYNYRDVYCVRRIIY